MRSAISSSPGSKTNRWIAATILLGIVGLGPLLETSSHAPHTATLWTGYGIALLAIGIGLRRGGIFSPHFWFLLAAAYPLVTPLLVQDILGYPFFSAYAKELQNPYGLAVPVFAGALAALYLAIAFDRNIGRSRVLTEALRHPKPPRLGVPTAFWLLVACVPLIIFFGWITEPGDILGMADYDTLREQRFFGVRFASGAWLLFELVSLACYVRMQKSSRRNRRIAAILFWVPTSASFIWLFLHAHRSETLGLAILLFCLFGPDVRRRRLPIPDWINKRTLIFALVLVAFSVIGYYRVTLDWSALQRPHHIQAPGGSGNNLLTYIAAHWLYASERLQIQPLETYWYYLQNLPPEFLGFPRAPTAYDIVDSQILLMGGQYWLMEPIMNLGFWGIAAMAMLVSVLITWSTRSLVLFQLGACGIHRFLQGGMFIAMIFRTMWYGPDAAINGAIMALLAGVTLDYGLRATRRTNVLVPVGRADWNAGVSPGLSSR